MSEEQMVRMDILFGSIDIESRMRPDGCRVIGEGRKTVRDRYGVVVSVSEWEPTGLVLHWPEDTRPSIGDKVRGYGATFLFLVAVAALLAFLETCPCS